MGYNVFGKYIRVTIMILPQTGVTLDEFRAVLTSPFLIKKVTINSHDLFNPPQPAEETFSRGDFGGIKSVRSTKLQLKQHNVGVLDYSKSSANIVKQMIQDGYSADNAIDMQRAVKAYGLNAINANGGVSTISNNFYEV